MAAIREAKLADSARLLEIYTYYVTDTAITFETEVPELAEFQRRMEIIQQRYPYLVAEADGKIVGYAYASAFHVRAAYAWAAESAIYVDRDCVTAELAAVFMRRWKRHCALWECLTLTLVSALRQMVQRMRILPTIARNFMRTWAIGW